MTQRPMTATDVLRYRIRALRERRGMSAQELANRCASLGAPSGLNRQTIANLENGRRAIATVDELLVLAAALDVPPVLLLIPPDEIGERTVLQVTPDYLMSAWGALYWITGESEQFMPSSDPDGTVSPERRRAWRQSTVALRQYQSWLRTFELATKNENKSDNEVHTGLLGLSEVINAMLSNGINPPPLPTEWVEIMRANGWLERPDEVPIQPKE